MPNERFLTSTMNKRDFEAEETLRPQSFQSFPGQKKTKDRLEIYVEAAKRRGEPLGHLLLSGPPGLGKTTLAYIIAKEKGANIKTTSGPVIEKPGDLAGLLTSLEEGDILFIDEIHRLNITVEEYLYSAMEDFFIDIMIDQGPGARSVRLNIPKFTLIGATTRQGLLSSPLRSRFELALRLDYYAAEDLQAIVQRSAGILDTEIEAAGLWKLPPGAVEPRVLPTIFCAGQETSLKSVMQAALPKMLHQKLLPCLISTIPVWMRWINGSLRPSP